MNAAPVHVVDRTEAAATLLHPVRLSILRELRDGDSAAGVARKLRLPRQKVNYHLRTLESAGLVEEVEERRKGNCLERIVRATATSYLVGPQALGGLGTDPSRVRDRFSSAYLIALAARTIREVSALRERADRSRKKLPTLTLETDVRFASAADRKAFTEELATAVAQLVSRYHDEEAPRGRRFRLQLHGYPAPPEKSEPQPGDTEDATKNP